MGCTNKQTHNIRIQMSAVVGSAITRKTMPWNAFSVPKHQVHARGLGLQNENSLIVNGLVNNRHRQWRRVFTRLLLKKIVDILKRRFVIVLHMAISCYVCNWWSVEKKSCAWGSVPRDVAESVAVMTSHCVRWSRRIGRPGGVDNAGQSRRAWPLTHRSASHAAQMMTIGQAQGTPLGHQRSLWQTGQRGEVDKWTGGQQRVSRGSVGTRHRIVLTSTRRTPNIR